MFSLNGKTALITGGSSGIGLATARRFADAGARVVIVSRSNASDLADSFGGEALQADVADESQVEAVVTEVVRRHHRIDVLVNSAGVIADAVPITEVSAAAMRRHFDVNVMGVWAAIRHAAPHMEGGSIVNLSSIAGLAGVATYAAYAASKAAVISLTQVAAVDLAPRRIRVNAVCPGSIDTPMLQGQANMAEEVALIEATSAAGRVGLAEEVAALVHFLAADDCRYVNGQAILIDGRLVGLYKAELMATLVATALNAHPASTARMGH